jgi:hypothetical protein
MTSIKHFTGFDISGKSEAELFDAAKGWELMWMPQWVKLIDEILEMRRKLYSTDFHYRLSKGNVTIV